MVGVEVDEVAFKVVALCTNVEYLSELVQVVRVEAGAANRIANGQ